MLPLRVARAAAHQAKRYAPRIVFPAATTTRQFTSSAPKAWVPLITETVAGGFKTSDIFSKLLSSRIITLSGPIDDTLSAVTIASLLYLESDSPSSPITLYINSPGGSVTAGLAIYDTMTYIRCPVHTVVVGQAASMGSLLLCGGEKGKRFALPNSSVMIHQPSGGYSGQATDIAIHAEEILRVRKDLNRIYQRHLTKRGEDGELLPQGEQWTLEQIEFMMERDKFFSAQDALRLGIVDEILDRRAKPAEDAV